MFMLDGKVLQVDTAFVHAGFSYPSNWLRLTTLAEKEAIGITEVPDPVRQMTVSITLMVMVMAFRKTWTALKRHGQNRLTRQLTHYF